jgi:toxin CcdB
MAQFDVYRNANPKKREEIPFLLDLQSDLLDSLATRAVAPLIPAGHLAPISRLNPVVDIERIHYMMLTQEVAGVPGNILGEPVCSLEERRQDILDAIDFLITGI